LSYSILKKRNPEMAAATTETTHSSRVIPFMEGRLGEARAVGSSDRAWSRAPPLGKQNVAGSSVPIIILILLLVLVLRFPPPRDARRKSRRRSTDENEKESENEYEDENAGREGFGINPR
jgi:hypothetical protein